MALENTLPDILEFTGNSITQGDFKVALNKLILYLNEVLGADGSKAIPSGIICLWSGSVDNIPDGWALCNGENGTEDLRDKFIVGAGRNYAVNATGGNASQTVNLSGSTGATTLTVNQMPSHTHYLCRNYQRHGGYSYTPIYVGDDARDVHVPYTPSNYIGPTLSAPTIETGGSRSHSHSLSGSATVSTLPPYYAKCYIQKL